MDEFFPSPPTQNLIENPANDRPPHCGLRPLPFMNSVWLFQGL